MDWGIKVAVINGFRLLLVVRRRSQTLFVFYSAEDRTVECSVLFEANLNGLLDIEVKCDELIWRSLDKSRIFESHDSAASFTASFWSQKVNKDATIARNDRIGRNGRDNFSNKKRRLDCWSNNEK